MTQEEMHQEIINGILYGWSDEKAREIAEAMVNDGTAFIEMHVEDDKLMVHVHPFGHVVEVPRDDKDTA